MASITDTKTRYGAGTIGLHWLTAALVLVLLLTGYAVFVLPQSPVKRLATDAHLAVGWAMCALVVVRVIWRAINPFPALTSGPPWQARLAHAVHWLLLGLLVALAVTGYVTASVTPRFAPVWGLFDAPAVFGHSRLLHRLGEAYHTAVSHLFVGVLALHMLAALKRFAVDRDGSLRRILWVRRTTAG